MSLLCYLFPGIGNETTFNYLHKVNERAFVAVFYFTFLFFYPLELLCFYYEI